METLGTRIKRLRQQKDISQRQFARVVGTSPGLISFIERDRNKPNYQIIGRMARVLGTSTDYLIYGEEARTESTGELIDRLKKEIAGGSDVEGGIKITAREKELIERYGILRRLTALARTDFDIILEILRRLESKSSRSS